MDIEVSITRNPSRSSQQSKLVCRILAPELASSRILNLPLREFHLYGTNSNAIAEDFFLVASVCYGIDLIFPRHRASDNWTRIFNVDIPVVDAPLWEKNAGLLADILSFLTGDIWNFSFSQRHTRLSRLQPQIQWRPRRRSADTVCLFSGGLDSLIGAVDFLATTSAHVALVGHYDVGSVAARYQKNLANYLTRSFGAERLHIFQGRIGLGGNKAFGEPTQRSRSLAFIGLGLHVAYQQGKQSASVLLIPENGFIALNPPLTFSRLGSCSTRTVHPYFLSTLQQLLNNLGLTITIDNPLSNKTKGQAIIQSARPEVIKLIAENTVSCAHPTRRQQWIRKEADHCGYCVPCLIRRTALHKAGIDDGQRYGFDVMAGELDIREDVASDFRALLTWLHSTRGQPQEIQSVVNRMLLPEGHQSNAYSVLSTQVSEIEELVMTKATPEIRKWASL